MHIEVNKRKNNSYIKWVEQLQIEGKITFSLDDVIRAFPSKKKSSITRSLTGLVAKRLIASVWNGFYVIIPLQYSSMGILPAAMYVDYLMGYLNRDYYVGMLNAATFYGSAHQKPQEMSIITTLPPLRGNIKKGQKLNFICRKRLLVEFTKQFKTEMGYVQVSSAELTAADLISNVQDIGGLNRAAAVLNELAEVMDFSNTNKSFFEYFPPSIFQRLGYILDVLNLSDIGDQLMSKLKEYNIATRKTLLKTGKPKADCLENRRWKIVINEIIEIEE